MLKYDTIFSATLLDYMSWFAFYILTLYIYNNLFYSFIENFMENEKDNFLDIKFNIGVSKISYVILFCAQDHEWHVQSLS